MMEQAQGKRKSPAVWDHFELLSENKVKCHICSSELSFTNKSTSSMLRHYRAKHDSDVPDTPRISSASRKQLLDEAQLNFILKDCQSLSTVTIKQMVANKYQEEREHVKKEVQQAVAHYRQGEAGSGAATDGTVNSETHQ
ncbi:uncharacterized protein LOC144014551 isoform X2 [Festucalex cinctus]